MRFTDLSWSLGLAVASLACSHTIGSEDAGLGGSSAPGASCGSDAECQSGSCLGSRCCAAACLTDPQHPECTHCDAAGQCQYPTAQCRAASCDPSTSTAVASGFCSAGLCPGAVAEPCSGGCDGTQCGSGCGADTDCAVGFRCALLASGVSLQSARGSCLAKGAGGASCAYSDDCLSAICNGAVCCDQTCTRDPAHPECTSCDASGACAYPSVECAAPRCDSATNSLVAASLCSAGRCAAGASTACGSYACAASGCGSSCVIDQDCAGSAYCAVGGDAGSGQGLCCEPVLTWGRIHVDAVAGADGPCCGTSQAAPCRSIAGALAGVALAQAAASRRGLAPASQFTLQLTVDGGGGQWTADPFPLTALPPGLTLYGPGVRLGSIVIGLSGQSTAAVDLTLAGDPGNPEYLGVDDRNVRDPQTSVLLAPGRLNLSNVAIFNGWQIAPSGGELAVELGLDADGGQGGTVAFGAATIEGLPAPRAGSLVLCGTHCLQQALNDVPPPPGHVILRDHGPPGGTVLTMQNTVGSPLAQPFIGAPYIGGIDTVAFIAALAIYPGVDVDLERAPVFGAAPDVDAGLASGWIGVWDEGGNLTLKGAQLQGYRLAGLAMSAGTASVTDTRLTGNGCYGIWTTHTGAALGPRQGQIDPLLTAGFVFTDADEASLQLLRSTVAQNFVGVFMDADGLTPASASLDLSGGDAGPGLNQLSCNARRYGFPDSEGLCASFDGTGLQFPGADAVVLGGNRFNGAQVGWGPQLPTRWSCGAPQTTNSGEVIDPNSCVSGASSYSGGALEVASAPAPAGGDSRVDLQLDSPTLAVSSCP